MKNIHLTASLALLLAVTGVSAVSAQTLGVNLTGSVNSDVEVSSPVIRANVKAESNANAEAGKDNRASSSNYMNGRANDDDESASATTSTSTSTEHRSVVATFVRSLLDVADRESGIGAEVRTIARTQNDSASTTASAMAKVESRNSARTFFFGSDYKSLGSIRSEIAKTANNIDRLRALLDETVIASDRAELVAQINALTAEQVRIEAYVKAHESVFSLLGWFNKLFQ